MSAPNLPISLGWFPTATPPKGEPAYGIPERTTWDNFVSIINAERRIGEKDGPNFVPARFSLETDGRQVRRQLRNVLARSAVALDIETNKATGEVPPPPDVAANRIQAIGHAAVIYTSHNHRPEAARYRIVLQLGLDLSPDLPAPELVAEHLGLAGVMDTSKRHAASLFYLPSSASDADMAKHQTITVPGEPIGQWLSDAAAARKAKEDAEAEAAQKAAAERRAAKIAAGFDPTNSVIEAIRHRLPDLDHILTTHGYDKSSHKSYRHPNSESGSFGLTIRTFGNIERCYSHNASDPLHHSNLPAWCTVKAVDVFDAVVILDYSGDRDRALRDLIKRYELSKTPARRAVAKIIFQLVRQRANQETIEGAAYSAGYMHGLTRDEVEAVSHWVASKLEAA